MHSTNNIPTGPSGYQFNYRAAHAHRLLPPAPLALQTLSALAASFTELRGLHEAGQLTYPYSLREAVAAARHMQAHPDDPAAAALLGLLAYDAYDPRLAGRLEEVFAAHGLVSGLQATDVSTVGRLELRFERADGSLYTGPKTKAADPKVCPGPCDTACQQLQTLGRSRLHSVPLWPCAHLLCLSPVPSTLRVFLISTERSTRAISRTW